MNINSNNPSNLPDFTPLTLQLSTSSHLPPLPEQSEAQTLPRPRPPSRAHNIARLNRALPTNLNFQKVLDQRPLEASDDSAFKLAAYEEIYMAATSSPRLQWNEGLTVGQLRIPISVTTSHGQENATVCGTLQCDSDQGTGHETATLSALAVAAPSSGKLYLLGEYMPSRTFNRDYRELKSQSDLTHLVDRVLGSLDAQYPLTLNLLPDGTAQHQWSHDEGGVHETRATALFNSDGKLLGLAIHPGYAEEPTILGQAPTIDTEPTVDKGKGVATAAQGERSPTPDGDERWQITPDQYPALDAMNTVQGVAGPAQTSTSRSHAASSTTIIPLKDVPGGIVAWLNAHREAQTLKPATVSFFLTASRFIETTGISLEDLRLDQTPPLGLSRQSKELLYVSLVALRDTQLSNAHEQAAHAVPADDNDLTNEIRKFASDDRLRLPPHLLVALPPVFLCNAIVQSHPPYRNRTYGSLDAAGREDCAKFFTPVRHVLQLLSKEVLKPYGERAKPMYGAGVTPKAPVGYRPTHRLHLEFYNRHFATMTRTRVGGTQVTPTALTSRMNAVFSSLEGRMGPLDRPQLEEKTHTVDSLRDLIKSLDLTIQMKDRDLNSLIRKLVAELPGDIETYRNSQQLSAPGEAGASTIAGRTRRASGSPEGGPSTLRQRIESPDYDAGNA